ncbi:MAG: hypothetical protein LH679_22105 [Cyanobacteria bacterium CAN_BIN43]|nr:hypothetical protein [Cyanobacteria bacterium CAN_BIN43]
MGEISGLLTKLLENAPLTTLFIGVFLTIFSGVEKIPIGNTTLNVSPQVKLILLIIGIALTLVSTLSLFKDNFFNTIEKHGDSGRKAQQELAAKQASIDKLNILVQEIRAFVELQKDEVSLEVVDILNGAKNKAREYQKEVMASRLTAKWLSSKKKALVQSMKFSDLNSKTLDEFQHEIERYVELIIESLVDGTDITPGYRKIVFHIGYPFPYVEAIRSLKSQISNKGEFNIYASGLEELGIERLNNCIDNLVKDILSESSG